MKAEALIQPVVEAAGLELAELRFVRENGVKVLRAVVDGDGGLDLDTLSELSERISRRLDVEGFDAGEPYVLEVGSPGLERRLDRPQHFRRVIGRSVRLTTREPVAGSTVVRGEVVEADDTGVTIRSSDREERRLRYEEIASARTEVDWKHELARGTG